MRLLSVAVVLALVAEGFAAPSVATHSIHEKRAPTHKWTKRNRVSARTTLPVRIGLSQNNLDRGDDLLMEVYVSPC